LSLASRKIEPVHRCGLFFVVVHISRAPIRRPLDPIVFRQPAGKGSGFSPCDWIEPALPV
jgi:hypothetical protein